MEESYKLSLSELEKLHSFVSKDIFDFICSTDGYDIMTIQQILTGVLWSYSSFISRYCPNKDQMTLFTSILWKSRSKAVGSQRNQLVTTSSKALSSCRTSLQWSRDFWFSNHSLCAVTATRLYQANIDEQLIMEQTSHHSLEGVREYKRTSDNQKEQLSDLLNSQSKENVTPTDSSKPGQLARLPPFALQLDNPQAVSVPTLPTSAVAAQNSHPFQFSSTLSMYQNIMPPIFNFNFCTVTINYHTHHT